MLPFALLSGLLAISVFFVGSATQLTTFTGASTPSTTPPPPFFFQAFLQGLNVCVSVPLNVPTATTTSRLPSPTSRRFLFLLLVLLGPALRHDQVQGGTRGDLRERAGESVQPGKDDAAAINYRAW